MKKSLMLFALFVAAAALSPGRSPAQQIADRPDAPAQVKVNCFGLDAAVNRAPGEADVVCRLEDAGVELARNLTLSLSLPEGVRLVDDEPSKSVDSLEEGGRIAWQVRSDEPLQGAATLKITGENFAPLSMTADLTFTARLPARPAIVRGKPYVPAPEPVESDYLVGAYYFPGWKPGTHFGWARLADFPERKPVLGWYQEGEPEVADWHIKWAVEHGISFFAYDWYWDRGRRQLEHALHDGYFKSQYRKHLKFCLLWANHNPAGSASEEDLLEVTQFWLDHYFNQPEYLTIGNKPVVIIFSPGRITSDMGVEKAAAAFEKMRALCRRAGFEGLYLAGCTWPNRGAVEQLKAEGYDAATGYNYPSAGVKPEEGKRSPYESAIEGYRSFWETIAGYGLLDYIPVTDPGWDSRPWHGDKALVRTGRDPEKFKRMLELARQFADAHPVGPDKQKIVLVEAWNEFGEGAAIEPQREFGFGHLDAVREVFTNAGTNHQDVIPQDVGLAVRQWKPSPPKTAWEFNTDDEPDGWQAMMGLDDFRVKGGAMTARVATRDPAFACDVRLDTRRYRYAILRMKLDAGSGGQLFWRTAGEPESEAASLRFATTADGEFHEYLLDLGKVATWRDKVTRLRLDPNSDPGSHVEVDFIRMLPRPPE